MGNCKAVPVGVKGKLKSWNGHTVVARRRSKMLADVGMVKMYSKSVHVNDLGFAWTGPPPCCTDRLPPPPPPPPSLHGPALLLVPTVFPLGGFAIPCRYTLHHPYICPCLWRNHLWNDHIHNVYPAYICSSNYIQ